MNLYESMENDPIGVTHRSMENIFFFHLNLRYVYLHTIVSSPATPPCQVITNYYKGVFLLLTLPRNQGYFDRGNFRTKEGNIIVRKIHELDLHKHKSVSRQSFLNPFRFGLSHQRLDMGGLKGPPICMAVLGPNMAYLCYY